MTATTTLTATDLWSLVGDALTTYMRATPRGDVRADTGGWLALSNEPLADFNIAIIPDGPHAEARLREYADAIAGHGVPAIMLLGDIATALLGQLTRENNLQHVGAMPLMVYEPAGQLPGNTDPRYETRRVESAAELRVANGLLEGAFGFPREPIDRLCTLDQLATPGFATYITWAGGQPMSAVTTITQGPVVGVWSMATPVDRQRQGAGKALLTHVMAEHAAHGATSFYLGATEAGYPLYTRVGFSTLIEVPVWVAGESLQFATH